jgi:hypothetical protein
MLEAHITNHGMIILTMYVCLPYRSLDNSLIQFLAGSMVLNPQVIHYTFSFVLLYTMPLTILTIK